MSVSHGASGSLPLEPAKYRSSLEKLLLSKRFVAEGGLETTLIFDNRLDLPFFASFVVALKDKPLIARWQRTFFDNARSHGCGYWLDMKTWRASPDYGDKLKVDLEEAWKEITLDALRFRAENESPECPIVISGVVGPRRDGYKVDPSHKPSVDESREYHRRQIHAFARHGADVIAAYTMNHFEEAAGIVLAARDEKMPCVISFTVETDGKLVSGETVAEVIRRIDEVTDKYALFYMINCAHPTHMENALKDPKLERSRLRGFFPNSSKKSHAELDKSTEIDRGEPDKIGGELIGLLKACDLKPLVVGGCCGTSIDHVRNITESFSKSS